MPLKRDYGVDGVRLQSLKSSDSRRGTQPTQCRRQQPAPQLRSNSRPVSTQHYSRRPTQAWPAISPRKLWAIRSASAATPQASWLSTTAATACPTCLLPWGFTSRSRRRPGRARVHPQRVSTPSSGGRTQRTCSCWPETNRHR